MENILVCGADIITMDPALGTIQNGEIAIEKGIIKSIGAKGRISSDWKPDRVIAADGSVVLPGFVNTHTHAAMSLLRSYADDLQLMDWLQNKIWPIEANLVSEDIYWGSMLASLEMIKGGTTTFADMYFFMPDVARAVEDSGMRAVLSRGMAGVAPTANQALIESREFVRDWHRGASGRITVQLGPHAPYTCPPAYLEKVIALAAELGVGIHIHLAETKGEVENCIKDYGKSPIHLMHHLGLFTHQVLAAHCVHLTDEEMDIMAQYNVGVAHNPGSNMKLASGIAPVTKMLSRGIAVGLGTDGAASNNNLDMIEEIRLAALLQKVHTGDPTVIPANQALEMGTLTGAQALGLSQEIGSLSVGKKADLIVLNCNAPHMTPKHDVASLIVYAGMGSDVDTVIIDGRVVMEKRQVLSIDEEKVLWHAQKAATRLADSVRK